MDADVDKLAFAAWTVGQGVPLLCCSCLSSQRAHSDVQQPARGSWGSRHPVSTPVLCFRSMNVFLVARPNGEGAEPGAGRSFGSFRPLPTALPARARRHRAEEPDEEEEVVEAEEETWARSRAVGPLASLPPRPGEAPGHSAPAAGAQARSTATQGT